MSLKMNGFWSTALLVVLAVGLSAQTPAQPPAQPPGSATTTTQQKPTFRVQVDLVTNDIVVRDDKGNFIPDLKKDEFEVYEDGVKQELTSMTVVTGGRVTNVLAPPPPPPPEGIILPPSRPKTDVSGRIFLFFVDDLHLQFHNTGRVRDLFKRISKELVHDGDMFGIVSSGPSSIAVDMTYDKARLDEAIKKIAGSELKPTDIINGSSGAEGPSEVRYRAHVAFSTVNDLLNNLESVHNRRKALVYVSDGYDFNPFQDARLGLMEPNSPFAQNEFARSQNQMQQQNSDGTELERRRSDRRSSRNRASSSPTPISRASSASSRVRRTARTSRCTRSTRAVSCRHGRHRRAGGSAAVERVRPEVAGQSARHCGRDRRHRRRQPERFQQGAEAD